MILLNTCSKAKWRGGLVAGLTLLLAMTAPAIAARISIADNDLNNIFDAGKPVTFEAAIHDIGAGSGTVTIEVTDFVGKSQTFNIPVESADGGKIPLNLDLGTLQPGYYELKAQLQYQENSGETAAAEYTRPIPQQRGSEGEKFTANEPLSFGVFPLVDRTAAEARAEGSRFGLKIWKLSEPGVWWRQNTVYDVSGFLESTVKLGLQWTRHDFVTPPKPGEPGIIGTYELVENFPVNVVHKVEGYPLDLAWDEERYGPLEEWKKKKGNRSPSRTTVPAKKPYQAWLKEQVSALPEDQDVFEIGNEVWEYMSGEDFAEWAQMAAEAIKEVRPDAKVGADPGIWGKDKFSGPFLKAGGMDNMDILIMHPYSFTPLPEHRVRQVIRNARDALRERTGKDYELYITEYGWPTAPEDRRGHSVSEELQAARTTRQSLMLYAEDAKALIPHWMADREYDITEREHWFGFYRLSGQPKPVLIAHANAARMIDGSRFVGDLWYGPGVGAMLFERDGEHTLALWTAEEEKTVEVDTGASEVSVVNLVGTEEIRQTQSGKLQLQLDGNVIYLVGVSPSLADQATPPDGPLNPERWSTREGSFAAVRAQDLQVDGNLSEWSDAKAVQLTGDNGAAKAQAMFKWDDRNLYVAIRANGTGDEPGDFTIGLSTVVDQSHSGRTLYEYFFTLAPSNDGGAGKLTVSRGMTAETGEYKGGNSQPGYRWAVQSEGDGWTAELALPVEKLKGYPRAGAGSKIGVHLVYKRGDDTLMYGDRQPRLWPYLTQQD